MHLPSFISKRTAYLCLTNSGSSRYQQSCCDIFVTSSHRRHCSNGSTYNIFCRFFCSRDSSIIWLFYLLQICIFLYRWCFLYSRLWWTILARGCCHSCLLLCHMTAVRVFSFPSFYASINRLKEAWRVDLIVSFRPRWARCSTCTSLACFNNVCHLPW